MRKFFEKGLYASLGFWLLIHEKADEIIREMIKKGEMAPEEGRKFLDELSTRVNEEKEFLKNRFGDLVQASLKDVFVTRDEFEKLSKKVSDLEKGKSLKKSPASASHKASKK